MIKKRLVAAAAVATLVPLTLARVWWRRRVERPWEQQLLLRGRRQPDGAGLLHR